MQTTSAEKIDGYTRKGWWGEVTLQSLFQTAIDKSEGQVALVDPLNRNDLVDGQPMRLSFQELDHHVDRIAATLFAEGLRKDDCIVVQLPNTVEIVAVFLAAARLGVIVSPLAIQYGTYELKSVCKTIEPKAYLAFNKFRGEEFALSRLAVLPKSCEPVLFGLNADIDLSKPGIEVSSQYQEYVDGAEHSANDIMSICWTSGTTGRPKGVPRSHNHWLSSTLATEDSVKLENGASILCPFPFINMAAIGGFLYYWLKIQGRMILHHPFEPMVFLKQLQDEECVYTIAPPAALNKLLVQKDQILAAFDLSNLRTIGSGSAPLDPDMIKGFTEAFDVQILNIFGSNEGMALIGNQVDIPDLVDRARYFPRFGRPEFSWENKTGARLMTRIVDVETRAEITLAGSEGELEISGVTVFDGYYNSPSDNAEAFTEDRYFKSGDLFEIGGDNNQFYRFVGRCKDLIIRGGVNISPEELDEILNAHPDIVEAAVYGYPDKVMGEKVCAVIVPNPGTLLDLDDITSHFKTKDVAKFKWPEKLKFVKALPRNPMNKVVRRALSDD